LFADTSNWKASGRALPEAFGGNNEDWLEFSFEKAAGRSGQQQRHYTLFQYIFQLPELLNEK
jgi:hypothetical protein